VFLLQLSVEEPWADMLDMEVRARIHQVIAEEAGKYNVFDLPSKKNDIMKAVREDVVPFFKKKGNRDHHDGDARRPVVRQCRDSAGDRTMQARGVAAQGCRRGQGVPPRRSKNKTLLLAARGQGNRGET